MVEESNPEPPTPPDIRPFGRIKSSKPHDTIITTNTIIDKTDELDSYSSLGVNEHTHEPASHAQPRRAFNGRVKGGKLARHLASSSFFLLFVLLATLPAVSAAIASPSSSITGASDPFTSYDQITPVHHVKSTPILSFLAKLFGYVGVAITYLTGMEMDNGPVGYIKRELTKTQKIEAGMIPVLVILSGIFAGLTLGYFSIDPTQLQVLSISGTPKQQQYARRILPVRKDAHLLLTTLILGNMIVNEALPVVSDPVLGGGIQAVVASTAMVVIFSEIIPQSICSRYGLLIGASMAWPVRVMIWLAYPIAWPIAKLLEYILGAHHGIIYRRSELRELIKIHAAGAEGGGDLDFDTVQMAQGALDLAQKVVKEAMTPIDQVFMLPIEAKLDYETLGHVVRSGHSRIPVYQMVEVPDINLAAPGQGPAKTKMVKKVIGSLLVKSCVLLDPEDATPLATVPINAIPSVPYDEPMTNMLNVFQEGRSHMAIVSRRPRRVENDGEDTESVMTAAAGGLRERFMRKVAEIAHHGSDSDSSSSDNDDADHAEKGEKKTRRKKVKRSTSGSSTAATANSPTSTSAADEIKEKAQAQAQEADAEKKKKSGLVQAAKLTQLEQAVPADAQMAPAAVEKFFEGLEGAPLGIITLEDVLEELIGEEIYDEYDEHGVTRSAASAFVPREAALAARKAALAREKLAQAASTPLPATEDTDIDAPAPAPPSTTRRVIPKLPLPKFSLGKRPTSQPGRARTTDMLNMSSTAPATAHATPVAGNTPPPQPQEYFDQRPTAAAAATPGGLGGELKRTASPGEMEGTPAANSNDKPRRSQSEIRTASRRTSAQMDAPPTATSPAAAPVPLKGLDPVSAVPARLLPGGVVAATPSVVPPSNANLLSEALLIERGRRRMVAGAGAGGVSASAPGMLRVASTGPALKSAAPSRQPTPPSVGAGSATSMPLPLPSSASSASSPPALPALQLQGVQVAAGAAGQGQGQAQGQSNVLSPQPVQGKRMPKFKSVPASAPGTGVPASSIPGVPGAAPGAGSVPGTPPL